MLHLRGVRTSGRGVTREEGAERCRGLEQVSQQQHPWRWGWGTGQGAALCLIGRPAAPPTTDWVTAAEGSAHCRVSPGQQNGLPRDWLSLRRFDTRAADRFGQLRPSPWAPGCHPAGACGAAGGGGPWGLGWKGSELGAPGSTSPLRGSARPSTPGGKRCAYMGLPYPHPHPPATSLLLTWRSPGSPPGKPGLPRTLGGDGVLGAARRGGLRAVATGALQRVPAAPLGVQLEAPRQGQRQLLARLHLLTRLQGEARDTDKPPGP